MTSTTCQRCAGRLIQEYIRTSPNDPVDHLYMTKCLNCDWMGDQRIAENRSMSDGYQAQHTTANQTALDKAMKSVREWGKKLSQQLS